MKAKSNGYYSPSMKEGTEVTIDKIKFFPDKSIFKARVINIWKRPLWFNITWFNEIMD